jgi:hypothetical protein
MRQTIMHVRDPMIRMQLELEQWGGWVRSGVGVRGYGHSVLGQIRGSTVPTPVIGDERALEIDRAMGRLKSVDEVLWSALWYTFVDGLRPHQWARRVGVGATKAHTTVLPQAVSWMHGQVGIGGV